jgi:hypothetical protein
MVKKFMGDRENCIKPIHMLKYNMFMKGVDRADQYLSHCSILCKI